MADEYDLLIVGGGLAGLTAAMYGGRFGLRTVLVEHLAAGGQVLNVEKIENFPGFPQGIAGFDLGPLVQEQAEAAGAEFVMDTAPGSRSWATATDMCCTARAPTWRPGQ
jgi:thioredoxin reductase (NADPH)